jgi:pyoverdine/dityrosine biosynthesis protein Dit1
MNDAIATRLNSVDSVGFKSLVDIFCLHSVLPQHPDLTSELGLPQLERQIPTAVTHEAELSRRILMAGCQPDRAAVRAKVEGGDASILALYRGFSRFMVEDLERNRYTEGLSRSQRKKLAAKVAFEMIMVSGIRLIVVVRSSGLIRSCSGTRHIPTLSS